MVARLHLDIRLRRRRSTQRRYACGSASRSDDEDKRLKHLGYYMQQSLLQRLAEYTFLVQLQERHNKTETLLSCEVQTDRGVRVMRGH